MKNIIYKTLMVGILSMSIVSCDLNQSPNDKLEIDKAWESVTDAERFKVGMYKVYKDINGGMYTYCTDYQSDLFNATLGFGNRGGDLYRWDFGNSQYDITDLYRGCYNCIREANNIIGNIDRVRDKLTGTPEENVKANSKLDQILGEAHLIRALAYNLLTVRFSKAYNPATANSDLGMPIVKVINVSEKPSRSTLAETYEFIKSELVLARNFLKVQGKPNTHYLTVDVIDALDARVNLNMQKYDEAIKSVETIVARYPLVTTSEALTKQWLNDESTEYILNTFSSLDERVNSSAVFLSYNTALKAYSPDLLPAQWVVDLYEEDDLRFSVCFRKDSVITNNVKAKDIIMLNKYPGNPALKKSDHDYYHKGRPFRVAELYLIAAEAGYMKKDETVAKKWLNDLRTARGASIISSSGETLFNDIKEEWVREFVGEGMRIDQLKRWGEGVSRKKPQDISIVMQGPDYLDLVIPANHMKFVWEIPANDLAANKNLKPNW